MAKEQIDGCACEGCSCSRTSLPQLIEVGVNTSLGGSIQIRKYELSSKYHFGFSEKWAVDFATEEEAAAFRTERMKGLTAEVDGFAQHEIDNLLAQKAEFNQ